MNKMEYRVDSKIIRQLSQFLMFRGVKDFGISFSSNHQSVTFIIEAKNLDKKMVSLMVEKIKKEREIEIEVYGWELLGDTDAQNDLDVLGSFIDEISVNTVNDFTQIKLKRYYKYNK